MFQIEPYKLLAGEVLTFLNVFGAFKCDFSNTFHTFLLFQFYFSAVDLCQSELDKNQRQKTFSKQSCQVNIWLLKGY